MKYNFLLSILNLLDIFVEFFNGVFIQLDAPSPWGIYFQDSATPQMEGLVELHVFYACVITKLRGHPKALITKEIK